jgi:hypothetical protein
MLFPCLRASLPAHPPPTSTPAATCFIAGSLPRGAFLVLIDAEAHTILIEDIERIEPTDTGLAGLPSAAARPAA